MKLICPVCAFHSRSGSDCACHDFSRVMDESREPLTHAGFLQELAATRSLHYQRAVARIHGRSSTLVQAFGAGRTRRAEKRPCPRDASIGLSFACSWSTDGRELHEAPAASIRRSSSRSKWRFTWHSYEPGLAGASRVPPEPPNTDPNPATRAQGSMSSARRSLPTPALFTSRSPDAAAATGRPWRR
jgi:hypothetical protein